MPASRQIDIESWQDAARARIYWLEALQRDLYGETVIGDPAEARDELDDILPFDREAVVDWLRRWPSSLGWRRYKAAMRQRAHKRERLRQVSLRESTAKRLRAYADRHDLTLDQAVAGLLGVERH